MTRTIFECAWRISILLLPWQTRWIVSEGALTSRPWEEATLAVYVSWVAMFVAFAAYLPIRKRAKFELKSLFAWAILILALVSIGRMSGIATFVWLLNVIVIAAFGYLMARDSVPLKKLALWFVLSLVPHAILGIIQFANQEVHAFTLLGIAEHLPSASGTSVIEHGEYRVLRSYGGYPHPNIFGGWLAVGLTLLPRVLTSMREKYSRLLLIGTGVLFVSALILTFSRGAVLAALFGFGTAAVLAFKRHAPIERRDLTLLTVVMIIAAGTMFVTQFDHVMTRIQASERLEQWSLEERRSAIDSAIEVIKEHPVVGVGLGASRLATGMEPPHVVPLVILLESGILGLIAVTLLVMSIPRPWDPSIVIVASIIALTDHYLWTLWSGVSLALFVFFFLQKSRG